jgi:restriction endonuclease S subunit
MASNWIKQRSWSSEEECLEGAPEGWVARQVEELYIQQDIGRRYDKKATSGTGAIPVIDQSSDGFIGWHNSNPGVKASQEDPVVTFANHTCEMRLVRHPFSVIQNVFPLRGRSGVCDTRYFYYATKGIVRLEEYKGHYPQFRERWIRVPCHKEQKAIAHILGAIDDKIELNRKTNETLEAMAKALFKSWFVDFDPVRAKAEGRPTGLPDGISNLFPDSFEDSELGEIPSGWESRSIRDWGRTECGKTPPTQNQDFYGDEYMFVTIPDLHKGLHIVSSSKQLSELGADSQRKKLLPPGSVMVSCIATPGLVGVAKEACFTNQQINSIIPNRKEASWFLALAMIENRDLLLSLGGGGSVFFNLSKGRFDEIEILTPSEDLISAFSGVVSALMDRCFATKQETFSLAKMRDTLLPKLISGELRIPDAERMLEEVVV